MLILVIIVTVVLLAVHAFTPPVTNFVDSELERGYMRSSGSEHCTRFCLGVLLWRYRGND